MSVLRFILCGLVALPLLACNQESSSSTTDQPSTAEQARTSVTVYKSPQCGCCGDWVEHMRENGFQVDVVEQEDLSELKNRLGVPQHLRSCHTAVIEGHVIEGHVPAVVVQRFLAGDNSARGLAVPGMPIGSPGMEVGDRFQAYSVMRFDETGASETFTQIDSAADQH